MTTTHDAIIEQHGPWWCKTLGFTMLPLGSVGPWGRGDRPDIFGIAPAAAGPVRCGDTLCIDVKMSVEDLKADRRKIQRQDRNPAHWCYYLSEPLVIESCHIDELWGWGLLYTNGTVPVETQRRWNIDYDQVFAILGRVNAARCNDCQHHPARRRNPQRLTTAQVATIQQMLDANGIERVQTIARAVSAKGKQVSKALEHGEIPGWTIRPGDIEPRRVEAAKE